MTKDGGPAFPGGEIPDNGSPMQAGMSFRDAAALAALSAMEIGTSPVPYSDTERDICADIATRAYGVADAMLAEREKERT